MAGDPSVIYEFVSEAKEHLANVADDLLALEKRDGEATRYRIDRLFRAVHSVKGGAGFFGCRNVERLAHLMETVLDAMREGQVAPSQRAIDALLAGADRILALLDDVEHSDQADVSAVCQRLRQLLPLDQPAQTPGSAAGFALTPEVLQARRGEERYLYVLELDLAEHLRKRGEGPLAVTQGLQHRGTILEGQLLPASESLGEELVDGPLVYRVLYSSRLPPDEVRAAVGLQPRQVVVIDAPPAAPPAPAEPPPDAEAPAEPPQPSTVEPPGREAPAGGPSSVRIPVHLLDRLMTLAGELVLVRNQTVVAVDPDDPRLRRIVQRLNSVTAELQETVMLSRLQPVGNLFGKFPRVVRDVARQLGKQIELTIEGREVELDKTILEGLSDPLTHLVRNACDHGIEPPEQRRLAGKPAAGRILLRARHEGGQIHIEIRDDGRGLDAAKLKRRAQELGLKTAAELARLSDHDALGLILLPGFSTAPVVTDLSGRGVGMDVVRTNIEQLGGSLDIDSTPGRGATFHLRLPLTLAIIPCLLVRVGTERFAIPQKDLEELVCVPADQVECTFDQEVYRLRGRLLPLVRLGELFQRRRPFTAADRAAIAQAHRPAAPVPHRPEGATSLLALAAEGAPLLTFAVVKVGSEHCGLVVDAVVNTLEVVVKPMHPLLRGLRCFSGATVLGDGRVALILDVARVAEHAGACREPLPEQVAPHRHGTAEGELQTLLLFRCGAAEQFAVALPLVRRLERIRRDQIERIGTEEFVSLAGVPTRVLRLDRYLQVAPCTESETMFLLVPRHAPQPVGVLLADLLDTQTLHVELHAESHRAEGILGTALVQGRLTLVLDLDRVIEQALPRHPEAPARKRRVLLVDDTQFFREVVRGYLESDGYEVVTAAHGEEGLRQLDAGRFDLVVSDIEMPVLDGLRFAEAVRRQERFRDLPLLALTTLSSAADRERALASGFNDHEVKLDRGRFLAAVARLLEERAAGSSAPAAAVS